MDRGVARRYPSPMPAYQRARTVAAARSIIDRGGWCVVETCVDVPEQHWEVCALIFDLVPQSVADLVEEGRVDGLLIASARPAHRLLSSARLARLPHVFVNREVPGSGRNVGMDLVEVEVRDAGLIREEFTPSPLATVSSMLRGVFDISHCLLTPEEQRAVFELGIELVAKEGRRRWP